MKKKKNILVITYWALDSALIQSYTLPYVLQIRDRFSEDSKVYLFTLNTTKSDKNSFITDQIEKLKAKNIHILHFTYSKFGALMFFKLCGILPYIIFFSIFKKIHYLHAWCTPGGAIAYLVSLFTGKKIILDSFEPHAVSMIESETWRTSSFAYKILLLLEKAQLKRATEVICAAPGMIHYSQQFYHVIKSRYFVKPACVNLDVFSFSKKKNKDLIRRYALEDCVTCVYAGKFGGLYLEEDTFSFFSSAYAYWGSKFRVLLLTSHSDEEVDHYLNKTKFPKNQVIKLFVPYNEMPEYLGLADFAICPVKPMDSKKYCTPIKTGEYWAMGLPVVITKNISIDSEIITKQNIGYVLNGLHADEYSNAVKHIDQLLQDPSLSLRIRRTAEEERNFKISEKVYTTIYA